MKHTGIRLYLIGQLFYLCLFAGILSSCKEKATDITPSSEFAPYVTAYSGGIVSQRSTIRIELAQEQPMVDLGKPLERNPFSFSPSLSGKAYWSSNQTLEFVPDEGELKPGEFYEATFRLGDFVTVEPKLQNFKFSFRVQERNFAIQTAALSQTDTQPDKVSINGEINFSDAVSPEDAGKLLTVKGYRDEKLSSSLTATDRPSRYTFQISNIPRQAEDYQLELTADGTPIGIRQTQRISVLIPARDTFRFLSAQRISQPENGIEIVFSAPLSTTQHLKGLVEIPEMPSSVLQVKDNKIYVYFESNGTEKLTLNLHEGIQSSEGKALGTSHSVSFGEVNLKPQVELAASAAILPDSKHLVIPFRAVNLYAVDMHIIRIFQHNVPAFMQNNTLSSSNELRRSGRLVYKKTLWLGADNRKDIHRWEDYSIDLGGLIRQEPGAIYRVILSFGQAYSAYPCGDASNADLRFADHMIAVDDNEISADEEAQWDTPQTYFYYNGGQEMDWSLYDWKERDNPCHPSYYMNSERIAACNVFASNLGMIVKRNSLNRLWIAVSSILDTTPVQGAQITVYNFQLQPIGTGTTDGEGFAEISCQGGSAPFLVVAAAGEEKAYVRVVDGEEQSVSRFDVGGKEIQKGLKGFVYGERGVWRPGDTLHVSFILEDREKRIPDTHPVTLELYNPRGQFYSKLISTQGKNGFHTFAIPTRKEDPTGLWNAYVKVGGTAFHKSLRIETIKPNRLKIHIQLPQGMLQASQKEVPATLTSSWLTGATDSGLKTKVEMSLARVNTQFKQYGQYVFNNPASTFTHVKTEVYEGTLDATGKTRFPLKLPQTADAPGLLNATLTARVFEPGGDASIYTQSVPFSPFTSYVGIRLNQPEGKYIETDKEHTFDVVTLTPDGRLTDRSNLEYKIYRMDWSWWWENQSESLGTYLNSSSITPVASGNLRTTGGKASFHFQVNYPDWGRYLVYVKDRESGHATGGTVYIDWPEWRGRSSKTDPSNLKMLTFSLDKESYQPGDKATAIIPASAGGRALITLENGSTILKREWLNVEKEQDCKYSFDVTDEMAPNVYLHISLLQPHAQTVNDLPIRMYGVMPVPVNNPQTILQPQITMPDVLRPETDFQVTVSERSGKPMTYTLAIVDDGLLDLTNFKTPNPWQEFYAREALGIRTWDMYDDVLGAKTGRYPAMFSTGGDETLKPADAKANRFKPVVRFIGPFYLDKGKKQTHTLKLPMYVGSVRAMVVAGQNGAYGNAEKTAQVRTPLMLLATLPRVLSTAEEIQVPVNIFALEKGTRQVSVAMQATGAGIQTVGNSTQTVTFGQPGDTLVLFRLKTSGQTGKATIRFTAQGGGQQAKETLEIDVRNPNPAVTLRSSQWIESEQSASLSYSMRQAAASGSSIQLEVSRIPSVDISRRFDFLYNYAHHCTEQLASKALPLLFVHQFKDTDAQEEARIKANVQEAIRQLYTRQLANGGFVYWPGNAVADEWVSSYAGMFLVLAQEKGYAVQPGILTRWKAYQSTAARNWRMPAQTETDKDLFWQSALQQAYRLYTLALAGTPEQGAMNRLKEQSTLPLQARWQLAGAYALTGQSKAAGELVFNLATDIPDYVRQNLIYGSPERDEAMILETLLFMNRTQEAMKQAKRVSKNLSGETYFSTQSTAFALMAMGRLAEKLSGSMDFTWQYEGGKRQEVKSAKAVYVTGLPTKASGKVTLTNRGEGALEAAVVSRLQLLNDTLPAQSHGLKLEVRYTDMNGKAIPATDIVQGSDFMAVVTVGNPSTTQDYPHLALTHILPSGWEIQGEQPGTGKAGYTYRDVRDDRVLTYFGLKRGERKQFSIRLQATYAGKFVLPAIQCEDMYDTSVMARTRAGQTVVSRK